MKSISKNQRWKCVCAYDGAGFPGGRARRTGEPSRMSSRRAWPGCSRFRFASMGADARTRGPRPRPGLFISMRPGARAAKAYGGVSGRAAAGHSNKIHPRGSPDFHARFSASGKIYTYRLHAGDADPFTRPRCWMIFSAAGFQSHGGRAAFARGAARFQGVFGARPRRRGTIPCATAAAGSHAPRPGRCGSSPRRTGFSTRWCAAWRERLWPWARAGSARPG